MVSEQERLKKELEEARAALRFQREKGHHVNEFYELEAQVTIDANSWLMSMSTEELEQRVERLKQDLEDLQRGTFER